MPGIRKWMGFREDSYPFEGQRFELDVRITYKYILMHFQPTEEPVFPSLQKPAFPNSNSTRNQVD